MPPLSLCNAHLKIGVMLLSRIVISQQGIRKNTD